MVHFANKIAYSIWQWRRPPQEFSLASNGYLANNSHGLELANSLHGTSYNFSLLTVVAFMKT
jgi:hypothetical protein